MKRLGALQVARERWHAARNAPHTSTGVSSVSSVSGGGGAMGGAGGSSRAGGRALPTSGVRAGGIPRPVVAGGAAGGAGAGAAAQGQGARQQGDGGPEQDLGQGQAQGQGQGEQRPEGEVCEGPRLRYSWFAGTLARLRAGLPAAGPKGRPAAAREPKRPGPGVAPAAAAAEAAKGPEGSLARAGRKGAKAAIAAAAIAAGGAPGATGRGAPDGAAGGSAGAGSAADGVSGDGGGGTDGGGAGTGGGGEVRPARRPRAWQRRKLAKQRLAEAAAAAAAADGGGAGGAGGGAANVSEAADDEGGPGWEGAPAGEMDVEVEVEAQWDVISCDSVDAPGTQVGGHVWLTADGVAQFIPVKNEAEGHPSGTWCCAVGRNGVREGLCCGTALGTQQKRCLLTPRF